MKHVLATAALVLGTLAPSSAQCTDPPAPTAGFALTTTTNVPFTLGDGYVTLVDVRHPVGAPPPCGWPLVVVVHGGGQSKDKVAAAGAGIAARGYISVAYDLRGDGSSWPLNDPLIYGETLAGVRERIDLFEVMETAEAQFPTLVDFDRLGVTGGSEGGRHSMWAAAWSGRVPPANPWRSAPFPTISAIAGFAYAVDTAEMWTPEGTTSLELLLQSAFGPWELLPAEKTQIQNDFLAQDFAAIRATMQPAGTELPPALAASTVPWYMGVSYDDKYIIPFGLDDAFVNGPPGVPRRVSWSTNHHNSPRNLREADVQLDVRLRWLDRFMKGEPNGVDTEPPVTFAITPVDVADYLDQSHLWDTREYDAWPLPFPSKRRWLEAGGVLADQPPTAASASDSLVQVSNIDIATYAATRPSVSEVTGTFIPLDVEVYDSAPLAADELFLGQFQLELEVTSVDADYQVHAVLADVDPLGNERWVSNGFTTVRGNLPPGVRTLSIESNFAAYVFRAGHQVRLRVENLVWQRPPTGVTSHLRMLPVFDDFTVDIHRSAARPSWLDIPLEPTVGPSIVASEPYVSDSGPEDVRFALQDDTASAGNVHFVALSLSGTQPGISILQTPVPLNPDALTSLCLYAPSVFPLSNFLGNLSSTARSEAQLSWSSLPGLGLAGAKVSAVGLVLDPTTGTLRVTPPISVRVVP